MSIMGGMNYEISRAGFDTPTPEWVVNERYEYCEDFYDSIKKGSRKGSFRRFVMKLRMLMF